MADVQPEHGYTRIANELLEALCRTDLPARHLRVALAVVRLTYGWKGAKTRKVSAVLLAKVTAIDRRNVVGMLADLERWGVVLVERAGPGRAPTLGIVKDYERWAIRPTAGAERLRRKRAGEPVSTSAQVSTCVDVGSQPVSTSAQQPVSTSAQSKERNKALKKAGPAVGRFPDRRASQPPSLADSLERIPSLEERRASADRMMARYNALKAGKGATQ